LEGEALPYPRHQINERVAKWLDAGLLRSDAEDGHMVWRWR